MPESSPHLVTSTLTLFEAADLQCRFFVVSVKTAPEFRYFVFAVKSRQKFAVHWGVGVDSSSQWLRPAPEVLPPFQPSTTAATSAETELISAQTLSQKPELASWFDAFCESETLTDLGQWQFTVMKLPASRARVGSIRAINFVLHSLTDDRWLKDATGKDFQIDLTALEAQRSDQLLLTEWEATLGTTAPPSASTQWTVACGTRSFILKVQMFSLSDRLELLLLATHPNLLVLHWGGCSICTGVENWQRVSQDALIGDQTSIVIDSKALQTVFEFVDPKVSVQKCKIAIKSSHVPELIAFVLKEHAAHIWHNNKGENFLLQVPQLPEWTQAKREAAAAKIEKQKQDEELREKRRALWDQHLNDFIKSRPLRDVPTNIAFTSWILSDDVGVIDCAAIADTEDEPSIILELTALLRVACHLHWGCVGVGGELQRRKHGEWVCPPSSVRPKKTVVIDAKAAQTPLESEDDVFLYKLRIVFPAQTTAVTSADDQGLRAEFGGVAFVLRESEGSHWYKAADGRDMVARLYATDAPSWKGKQKELVDTIIEAEVEWDHMTLMHRYQLCASVIDAHLSLMRAREDFHAEHEFWSWIFVWNRFSFLCWLDWQRRYNTKPKDLAHSAEVLSCKIARCWQQLPRYRVWTRLTLATMGRGGSSGQAIRDRILDIMHKHKLPETSGNFYEQWHQKLHNNTTPDDIGICLAVIKFLETGGDHGAFWHESTLR